MKLKNIIYIFITILIFNSCTIYKPDSGSLTTADYNQRVEVSNAHFDKVLTPIGVGSFIVGSASVGFLGYAMTQNSNYFVDYNSGGKQNLPVAGAVLGAFTGFTISYLLNKSVGLGNYKTPTNPDEWIKKANKNFLLVSQTSSSNFKVIHKTAETNYISKNIQDARDFAKVFPKSSNENSVVIQSGKVVSRSEIPELINLFPTNTNNTDIKFRYLTLSSTVNECIEAKNLYSIVDADAEKKASGLVLNITDVKTFKTNYPKSTYMNDVVNLAMSKITIAELPTLVDLFPKSQYSDLTALTTVQKKYIDNNTSSLTTYLNSVDKYTTIYTKAEVEKKSAGLVQNYTDAKMFKNRYTVSSSYNKDVFTNAQKAITRSEIPQLITLYPDLDSLTILKAKKLYAEKSSTIAECYNAYQTYPEIKESADKKASTLTSDITSCNSYFSYFPDGIYISSVKTKLASNLKTEYSKATTLLEKQKFVIKYKSLKYDPDNTVLSAIQSLNTANTNAEINYNKALNYDDYNDQMVMITFKTKTDYPAFLVMEDVKNVSLNTIDIIGPWVKAVYVYGAKGNEGIIMGKWYKKGAQGDFIGSLGSDTREVDLFVAKAGGFAKKIETVIDFDAVYLGSHADDSYASSSSYSYNDYEEDVEENYKSNSNCWKDNKIDDAEWSECTIPTILYKVTCVDYEGEEDTKYYYYWNSSDNKSYGNDCIFSYGQGYYESVFGSDHYLGDDGLDKALQELCGCGQ